LLQDLNSEQAPNFGLMTPQHMLEHLTWIIKSSAKQHENPGNEPSRSQLGFQKFIQKGAIFQHRPSDKTKEDLPPLKYASYDEALAQIPIAINRFYDHYEAMEIPKGYHPMMGELTFEQIELFHFMHCRYHLWQFGLLEQYP
jgi:oxepin-CoA hydrolase/3-oxo-5,6-dehydrosuberyl-CoA semialdehyde dehydrogenase